ncbi:hypothetical protein VZP55_34980 [Myxococcus faecalis]
MGELIGAGVELSVGEGGALEAEGFGVRRAEGLGLEEGVEGGVLGVADVLALEVGEQLDVLILGEQRQLGQTGVRVGGHRAEQRVEVPTQPLDRRHVEEVGVVLEPTEDLVRPVLAQLQQQVELGRAGVHEQIRGLEPRHGQVLPRGVLEAEHHLEQRVTAQVARGLQLLDELLEGQLLVRVRRHAHVLRAAQQLAEGGVAAQVVAQHQRVDEEADQRLQLRHVAAGDGRADGDVRLP